MLPVRLRTALPALLLCAACVASDEEDLGDIGNSKEDAPGITDKAFSVSPGSTRRFTFTADGPFEVRVRPVSEPMPLRVSVRADDMNPIEAEPTFEPVVAVTPPGPGPRSYRLGIRNDGADKLKGLLSVVPSGGGALPDPNAAEPPPADWQPPPVDAWPVSYVIFNNTACGHDCSRDDQTALKPRAVMIKMLIAAIDGARSTVRVSNFNISSSSSVAPVADALVRAMARGVEVRIVMDPGQNTVDSRTALFAQQGAQVRFTAGLTFENLNDPGVKKVGIMHTKMVVVDDQIVFTGSNNFSSTGFITNEENSVVLRAPAQADRIAAFTCDFERAFEAGVGPGEAQRPDDDPTRVAALSGLEQCNRADLWFPPAFALSGRAPAFDAMRAAVRGARRSIRLAPDMLAHPGLVEAIIDRAADAVDAGEEFTVEAVMDGSSEALGNPAFAECLADAARERGLPIEIRYWPGNEEIFQLLHHKFMLIDAEDADRAALFNGSANFSVKALKWSFENVALYSAADFPAVVDAFTTRFHALFAAGLTIEQMAAEGIEVPGCPL